jgi:hypothetical protein
LYGPERIFFDPKGGQDKEIHIRIVGKRTGFGGSHVATKRIWLFGVLSVSHLGNNSKRSGRGSRNICRGSHVHGLEKVGIDSVWYPDRPTGNAMHGRMKLKSEIADRR